MTATAATGKAAKVATLEELAAALGVAVRTVRRWTGIPRERDGSYDVAKVLAWREKQPKAGGHRPRVKPDDEYRQAKTEIEQLKLRRMRKDFAADVERLLVERARALATSFRSLPRKLGDKCAGRTSLEIQHVVAAEVRKILEDYSRPAEGDED